MGGEQKEGGQEQDASSEEDDEDSEEADDDSWENDGGERDVMRCFFLLLLLSFASSRASGVL